MAYIQTSALIAAKCSDVFEYVADLKHLPEWLGTTIQVSFAKVPQAMVMGAEYELEMSRFGLTQNIIIRIEQYRAGEMFVDRQMRGFFHHWVHTQKFSKHDKSTTLLTDILDYRMPYGLLGQIADDLFVRQDLTRILNYRYERINEHFGSADTKSKGS